MPHPPRVHIKLKKTTMHVVAGELFKQNTKTKWLSNGVLENEKFSQLHINYTKNSFILKNKDQISKEHQTGLSKLKLQVITQKLYQEFQYSMREAHQCAGF